MYIRNQGLGDDQGTHAAYWKELGNFVNLVQEDSSEIVKAEAYTLVLDSINANGKDFRNDNISRDEVEAMLETVIDGLDRIEANVGTKPGDLKAEAQTKIELARGEIDRVYREDR